MILAERADPADASHDDFLAHAARAADGLWTYLDTPVVGLWRDKMLDDETFVDEPAPASSFYHIIGAISALTAWRNAA